MAIPGVTQMLGRKRFGQVARASLVLGAVGMLLAGGSATASAAGDWDVQAAQETAPAAAPVTFFCAGPTAGDVGVYFRAGPTVNEQSTFFKAGPTANEQPAFFKAGPTANEQASYFRAGPTGTGQDACRRL